MTASVQTAVESGDDTWCPMYIGCARQLAYAMTSSRIRATISASARPSSGIGSSKRAAMSLGASAADTAPSPRPVLARYSEASPISCAAASAVVSRSISCITSSIISRAENVAGQKRQRQEVTRRLWIVAQRTLDLRHLDRLVDPQG